MVFAVDSRQRGRFGRTRYRLHHLRRSAGRGQKDAVSHPVCRPGDERSRPTRRESPARDPAGGLDGRALPSQSCRALIGKAGLRTFSTRRNVYSKRSGRIGDQSVPLLLVARLVSDFWKGFASGGFGEPGMRVRHHPHRFARVFPNWQDHR